MPGFTYTNIAIATAADTDYIVETTSMKVGAYTIAHATPPTAGARHVTVIRTAVDAADTPGTLAVVGKDLAGQAITETITPGADGVTVTGTKWFASITSATGAGWVIAGGNDTIVVGFAADVIVVEGEGELRAVVISTTAAGAVTLTDKKGTIATLKASIAEGTYYYDLNFSGYLGVALAAASDVTVIHTPSMPTTYAMS